MAAASGDWDGNSVLRWLESRVQAARLEQAAADRRGYEARDEYDVAAAEEWVCGVLRTGGHLDAQGTFAVRLKELLAQDDYPINGVHDDRRVDRAVRAQLRKLARMTKANEGFANTLRYQR